jgi:hypothetical protein
MRLCRLALAALAGAVACAGQRPPAAGPNVVTITATDYAFGGPDTIPAGLVTLRLVNAGKEPHQAGLVRVDSGKSSAAVEAAMKAPGAPPAWTVFVGGPDVVLPGDTANATQPLAPGRYFLVCFFPSPDGKLHLEKGMFRWLVVRDASAPTPEPDTAGDVTVTLNDYGFEIAPPLTSGTHTLRVVNAGPQLHELMLLAPAPGKSVADVVAWDQGGMKGVPPARPLGGIVGLTPGRRAAFTVTLAPGRYVVACFVPDAKDGKSHAVHGMAKEITAS